MIKKNYNHRFRVLLLAVSFCLVVSCKKSEPTYSYERDGFISGNGYYYTPPTRYPSKYLPYNKPASRDYRNPYAPPPKNYHPYYDSDRYYSPPTNYQTIPTDNDQGGPGPNTIY
jgi:hypothetical protein